jgi:hypothetical protein
MVLKGLRVTNYHAKRRVRFVCGSPSNPQCTNEILYGAPATPNTLDYIPSAGFSGYWNGSGLYS